DPPHGTGHPLREIGDAAKTESFLEARSAFVVRVEDGRETGLRQNRTAHQCRCVTASPRGLDRCDTEDADRLVGAIAHCSRDGLAVHAAEPQQHARIRVWWMDAADADR